MDMEDGELPSSEDERPCPPPAPHNSVENPFHDDILEDDNYVIIQRPKSSLPVPSKSSVAYSSEHTAQGQESTIPQQEPFVLERGAQSAILQPNMKEILGAGGYDQFGKRSYFNKTGVADLLESSDKESSSTSDSDDGYCNGKRSRMSMPTGQQQPVARFTPLSSSSSSSFTGGFFTATSEHLRATSQDMDSSPAPHDFFAEAAKFQKQRKPNLVWSDVIQEEEISRSLGNQVRVGLGPAEIKVTRGPETYFYERAVRQPRPRRASDSSDISSEGLSDNALHYLKDGTLEVEGEEEDGKVRKEVEERKSLGLPKSFRASQATRGSKRRRSRQKHKNKIISKLKKMKSYELAAYMGSKLKEEKTHLLSRAVEVLGQEPIIRVFLKTLKIEKRGGIMIKSHERRRTPGGVFLYLLRGDRRFPKNSVDVIFREDRASYEKTRKKKIASKRLRRKEELEKSIVDEADTTMKQGDDDNSDTTAVPDDRTQTPDQDGTDTGQLGDDSTQDSSVNSRDTAAEELSALMTMDFDGSES